MKKQTTTMTLTYTEFRSLACAGVIPTGTPHRTTTMTYAQFRREFLRAWADPRAAHNELTCGLNSIFDCALETMRSEPTYRSMLSACWTEYKRRSNA
jgi:hypothetical protein